MPLKPCYFNLNCCCIFLLTFFANTSNVLIYLYLFTFFGTLASLFWSCFICVASFTSSYFPCVASFTSSYFPCLAFKASTIDYAHHCWQDNGISGNLSRWIKGSTIWGMPVVGYTNCHFNDWWTHLFWDFPGTPFSG